MPHISFKNISKSFGDNTVIHEFAADIDDKEFLVLLGPSGCGKSTMLRMIAGLTDITSGELLFDGASVNHLEPRERNIAFVFQSYALYPHMTVRDNIAFPLVMDRFKPWYHIPIVNSIMRRMISRSKEVSDRVNEVAEMLELSDYIHRRPKALSGGQRQRVAVARALVREPSVYLLDEPLSNLDAKLRSQMRAEISTLYNRVGKTFIYVTHDQVEAMTMATRIIILNKGVVQQVGTPDEIYNAPANTFVAQFIGSPPMNLIPVTVRDGMTVVRESGQSIKVEGAPADGDCLLGIRAEQISLQEGEGSELTAHVTAVEQLGGESILAFRFQEASDKTILSAANAATTYYARVPGTVRTQLGSEHRFTVNTAGAVWFDETSGLRLEDNEKQRTSS